MARRGTAGTARPQQEAATATPQNRHGDGPARDPSINRGNGQVERAVRGSAGGENVTLSPQEISERAYQIFEREGRPDGKDMEHWLEAERQLRKEREPASSSQGKQLQSGSASGSDAPARSQRPDEAPRSARQHQAAIP